MEIKNQEVSDKECDVIRSLSNFDLMMLISDIHDNGWPISRKTLRFIADGIVSGAIEGDQKAARELLGNLQ